MQLTNYKKNKISLEELQALYHMNNYNNLVNLVNTLTEEGHLSPIKRSKLNGKKPPLFNRYHIIKEQEDVSKLTEELLYQLNPMLKNDYYIKNIETYKKDRPHVRLLNDFFQNHKENLQNAVSYNERSFEIWGREKFLLKEGGNSGGEGFLSAFVVLSSLLSFMRREDTDLFYQQVEGKVLLMDNPFAQTNASHLLIPLMDIAKKNNTQLICLTGLGGESIYNRFDNIYVLNLMESGLQREVQYLKGEHIKGDDPILTIYASQVKVEDAEQMELLF